MMANRSRTHEIFLTEQGDGHRMKTMSVRKRQITPKPTAIENNNASRGSSGSILV